MSNIDRNVQACGSQKQLDCTDHWYQWFLQLTLSYNAFEKRCVGASLSQTLQDSNLPGAGLNTTEVVELDEHHVV